MAVRERSFLCLDIGGQTLFCATLFCVKKKYTKKKINYLSSVFSFKTLANINNKQNNYDIICAFGYNYMVV